MSDPHPHGCVHVERVDHVLQITVDRTAKLNALTPKMTLELAQALTMLDDDPDLFVGVLCFAGKHSTAGLELPLFMGPDADPEFGNMKDLVDPYSRYRRTTKPLVCAVQGITFTAGIEMMLACDIVIAADDCRFSQLEPKRGIAALGGATIRFVDRGGWGNAMYHLLTGDEFDSAEAYRCGFVQEVVPAGSQRERALELAQTIAQNAPLAVAATKRSALTAVLEGEEAAIDELRTLNAECLASEDFVEGLASFKERRAANFTGR